MHRALWILVVAMLASCAEPTGQDEGQVRVVVTHLTDAPEITRIAVTVSPENEIQDLAFNASDGSFSGTLTVSAGPHTLTAAAYSGADQVGSGTADVNVVAGQMAHVSITILDSTGPDPVPDHSPVITSLVVSKLTAEVGEILTVTATAMDADGDALAYSWSSFPECGTFDQATEASTSWTATAPGTCTLTVTVTADGRSDSRVVEIAVLPNSGTGAIDVEGSFVPHPRITQFIFSTGVDYLRVYRTSPDATLRYAFTPGVRYTLIIYFDVVPTAESTMTVSDSCGGTISQGTLYGEIADEVVPSWTPNASSNACVLTATLTRRGLVDVFPVVVTVAE
jgi:hypothetical protein